MEKIYLPVRKRLMYDTDHPMDDQTSYMVVDDKGYIVSKKLSRPIAEELVSIMNFKHAHTIREVGTRTHGKRIAHFRVMIDPMEKPRDQVPFKNKEGELRLVDHPDYIKYLKEFKWKVFDGAIEFASGLPIKRKVQVICGVYCSAPVHKTLPLMQLAIIEGLCYAGIIRGVTNNTVANMDGSYIAKAKAEPKIEIFINTWE